MNIDLDGKGVDLIVMNGAAQMLGGPRTGVGNCADGSLIYQPGELFEGGLYCARVKLEPKELELINGYRVP